MDTLWQDLKYGAQMLAKRPGFTAVAVLTLALGIGANTAIFSVVNAVLLRPLPFREPDRLVMLWQTYPERGLQTWLLSQANFAAYDEQSRAFEKLAAYSAWGPGVTLTGQGEAERLRAIRVTADFFDVLGVQPALGRTFRRDEDLPGKNAVCVLSYGLWQRRFGGDPDILGRVIHLNNEPNEVVGVMPASFQFPSPSVSLWTPVGLDAQRTSPFFLRSIARLPPGTTPAQAESETTSILRSRAQQDAAFAGSNAPAPPEADLKTIVMPLGEAITGHVRTPLFVLIGAVALVLLIACANVANLMLARATTRAHEFALRVALGATSHRLIQQLLVESLLLSLVGGVAGALLAWWGVGLLEQLPLGQIPRVNEVSVDGTILAFTALLAVLTGPVAGLVPALRARSAGLQADLREGTRGGVAPGSHRTTGLLVAAQFSLSLVLLVGAGLLLKSFHRLTAVDPGFQPAGILTLELELPQRKYSRPEQSVQFFRDLIEKVRAVPSITSASLVAPLPFTGDIQADGLVVEGHEPAPGEPAPVMRLAHATPGYFRVMGVPLLQGRDFTEEDQQNSLPVAVVDETLVRRYWPDGNALGKQIRYGWDTSEQAWKTIVGVVGGINDNALDEQPEPYVYFPYSQGPEWNQSMTLVVGTTADPTAAASAIRSQLRQLDPDVPAFAISTMNDQIETTVRPRRLTNLLLGTFAVIALLLAAVGIYGVMTLEVNRRVREFGIRLALGAMPRQVFRSVVGRGLRLTALGASVGLMGALGMTRFLKSLLFEVQTTDVATYAAGVTVLVLAALAACWIPARRATRVDPIVALRYE